MPRTTVIGLVVAVVAVPAFWLLMGAATSTHGGHIPGFRGQPDVVTAAGRLEPIMSVTLGSSVGGVIKDVSCHENMRVKKGQICARIDPRPYQAQVDQDRASLATAKAQLEKDEANLTYQSAVAQRYKALAGQRAVSQDQLENVSMNAAQAKAQVDFDRATVAQHAASLEAAEIGLEYTNVVSPIDGVVISCRAITGETVVAQYQSPTLFVIASDLSKMQINAGVGEKYIDLISPGDRVNYSLEALPNRRFEGTVRQIRLAPEQGNSASSYLVSIDADNREGLFRPGMAAFVTIYLGKRVASAGIADGRD